MRRRLKNSWFIALVLVAGGSIALAQVPPLLPDQVEEDWQVVIAEPDSVGVGPQVTMIMSPTSDPSAAFFTFYMNYRDDPSWMPGGLQVKAYGAVPGPGQSAPLVSSATQGDQVCQTSGETITWTQRLGLSTGTLSFDIANGQSTTWGKFGQGQGNQSLSVSSTLTDLSSYKPDYSISKSGVSWQANRATSMTLLQVRYYSGGKLISIDTTPRTVNLSPGP